MARKPPEPDCCATCHFWLPDGALRKADQGLCRFDPPQIVGRIDGTHYSAFPPMLRVGWCGKFQKHQE